MGYPEEPTRLSPWAGRLRRAHYNAVENLVVFAALALAAHAAGVSSELTVLAAQAYLWARVAHAVSYACAIPWVRTVSFTIGWASQMVFAWALLTQGSSTP
jgi:uncharacterized MAPEG superfamily protein